MYVAYRVPNSNPTTPASEGSKDASRSKMMRRDGRMDFSEGGRSEDSASLRDMDRIPGSDAEKHVGARPQDTRRIETGIGHVESGGRAVMARDRGCREGRKVSESGRSDSSGFAARYGIRL